MTRDLDEDFALTAGPPRRAPDEDPRETWQRELDQRSGVKAPDPVQ